MIKRVILAVLFLISLLPGFSQNQKINVVVIGAHPDDCDLDAGGTAILFAKMGHRVLFVSATNGDAGHFNKGGEALAKIRKAEAEEAGRRFGITYKVLDNHDGLLMPDLKLRLELIKLIREWNADVVIGHRPYDYHPDHRNTAIAIQDAAYLVIVPNIAPETPALKKNPVFLYTEDRFQQPNPFRPDIVVDISKVFEQKVYALTAHQSQFFEWLPWTSGQLESVPKTDSDRLKWLAEKRKGSVSPEMKAGLIKWYGERGNQAKYAEAFEICEYGSYPNDEEIRRLFPMLEK
ncbi:MAG: GlcNAc-PI de-N-acetylase [Bacteroidetes bacterium GWB2_41_8]|nr:MAG: GlcNAc-PI de-N-acetylase [Bacteroidetes bacterium GWB2_41_8]